jgi:hypothetical protein
MLAARAAKRWRRTFDQFIGDFIGRLAFWTLDQHEYFLNCRGSREGIFNEIKAILW